MADFTTRVLNPDADGIEIAAKALADGELIAFPTETVYGLGADATNSRAVAGIFDAKNRPRFNPLIVHVPSLAAAQRVGVIEGDALRLAEAFWPGPLTLVVPVRPEAGLSDLVTAGLPTVAIRVPGTDLARTLLSAAKTPVAAPSANPSGRISPTRAAHVLEGLGGRISAVLDGGACSVGLKSTIVRAGNPPELLRPGGLPAESIEACLGHLLAEPSSGKIEAPGQLQSHYAPQARVRLKADTPNSGEVMLGFGAIKGDLNLSRTGDLVEASANLFEYLRKLDEMQRPIAVATIPETGLGRAINDRLRRAAAPRD